MRAMTLWQFSEVVDGFVKSKTGDKEEGLSQAEEDQLGALLDAAI
jgi:hypothetical protein